MADVVYPGDEQGHHLGAVVDGEIKAIVSLFNEGVGWRLRGMAVAPDLQGRGLGKKLVERAIADAKEQNVPRIWCNARTSALGFYQGLGFQAEGEEFEIEGVGPHFVMVRTI